MKILQHILSLCFVALVLAACDDENNDNVGKGESISSFKLVSPANFTSLTLNPGTPQKPVVLEWEAAKTGLGSTPTYRFLLDKLGGDFTAPVLSIDADNEGKDPKVTLTMSALSSVVSSSGTTDFIWAVEAKTVHPKGENKLRTNTFNMRIAVANAGISDFTYQYPARNEKIRLDTVHTDMKFKFSWNAATSNSAVTYRWIASASENDFSDPLAVLTSDNSGASPELTITNGKLMELLDQVEDAPGFFWKVEAIAGNNTYSPQVRFVWFEKFSPLIDYIYLVGDATPGGWDNNAGVALFRDPSNGLRFTYVGKLNAGNLKFLKERGKWAPQWGAGSNGALAYRPTEAEPDPPAISIPAMGYYTVVFNGTDNTYAVTPYDASGKPTYTTIGIIGAATPNGWGDPDTNMTKSAFDPHHWYIDGQSLTADAMKFRANDGWAVNWGAAAFPYGAGTQDGPNIPVSEAGNYLIRFCDLTGQYALIKKQ